jgi:hypothetical protein
MVVPCNRLDENKGIFGPFVAGQKDGKDRLLHADNPFSLYKKEGCYAASFFFIYQVLLTI